jgi:hypothetical protein
MKNSLSQDCFCLVPCSVELLVLASLKTVELSNYILARSKIWYQSSCEHSQNHADNAHNLGGQRKYNYMLYL